MRPNLTSMTTEILLRLLVWLSPGFPTGAFAHSHGLEWAVASGDVRDEASLLAWLRDVLQHGAGRSDAIMLRHASRTADPDALAPLCELALALAPGPERLAETIGQGTAFMRAATPWHGSLAARLAGAEIAYPVAVGMLAADHGIDADLLVPAFLQAVAANLVSAAVRLVPLGQSAGLRVLAALEPTVLDVARETRSATLDDLGGASWRADIASMRHEAQETRLFRT